MAALQTQDDDIVAGINVTPFVDIALVLLVIFMVTSSYITRAALEVELPQAASAGSAVDTTLNVVVARDGALFLDGQPVDHAALAARIQAASAADPKLQAVIAADKGVAYGAVVKVIDLVKTHGVKSFALNVERDAS
jgi:biopolymer transport protein ExbD